MATKYLGAEFDIHGGGLDLVFPHHENELAQSRCAGDAFARWWMHNGLVNVGAEKMSKSLGNSLVVADVVERVRPVELRYYLGAPHYRSMLDWSEDALAEADAAYSRLEGFVERATELVGTTDPDRTADPTAWAAFAAALDDDLGVPQAIAVVHLSARAGNAALADGDKQLVAQHLAATRAMLGALGLDPDHGLAGNRRWRPADRCRRCTRPGRARAARSGARAQGLRGSGRDPRCACRRRPRSSRTPRRDRAGRWPTGDPQEGSERRQRRAGQAPIAGQGPTPPAEKRTGRPAARRAAAPTRRTPAGPPPRHPRRTEVPDSVVGRNAVGEALQAGVPASALFVATGRFDKRVTEALPARGELPACPSTNGPAPSWTD